MHVDRRSFLGALLATGAATLVPIPARAAKAANAIVLTINGVVINGFDVDVEDFADLCDDDRAQRRFPKIVIRQREIKFDIKIELKP